MTEITDKDRIDFLEKIMTEKKYYTGKVMLRISTSGRGWRLHETSRRGGWTSVRDAIDAIIKRRKQWLI